jgi:hypothetical protein
MQLTMTPTSTVTKGAADCAVSPTADYISTKPFLSQIICYVRKACAWGYVRDSAGLASDWVAKLGRAEQSSD